MEDSLIDAAFAYAHLAEPDMQAGTIATGAFSQAMAKYHAARPGAVLWGFHKDQVNTRITITDAQGIVVFDTRGGSGGAGSFEMERRCRTLRGEYGARSSAGPPKTLKAR